MTSEPINDPLFHQRYGFSRDGDVLRVEIWTEPGYRETVVLSSPPPIVQRLLFPLLARFAGSNREPTPARAT
jgi:hypothetical protein